jgi:hypothetical protein
MTSLAPVHETAEDAVLVEGLVVRFGEVRAVGGVSFTVRAGESSAYSAPTARARRPRSVC